MKIPDKSNYLEFFMNLGIARIMAMEVPMIKNPLYYRL